MDQRHSTTLLKAAWTLLHLMIPSLALATKSQATPEIEQGYEWVYMQRSWHSSWQIAEEITQDVSDQLGDLCAAQNQQDRRAGRPYCLETSCKISETRLATQSNWQYNLNLASAPGSAETRVSLTLSYRQRGDGQRTAVMCYAPEYTPLVRAIRLRLVDLL